MGLKKHQEICGASDKSRVSFPKDEYYKFSKLFMYEDVPFKTFFTFQTVLHPVANLSDTNSFEIQYTTVESIVDIIAFVLIVVGPSKDLHLTVSYHKENHIEEFF
jgi:hypothetical protein